MASSRKRNDGCTNNRRDNKQNKKLEDNRNSKLSDEYPNFSCDPFRSMLPEEKRDVYQCGKSYLDLEKITDWTRLYKDNEQRIIHLVEINQQFVKKGIKNK